MTEDRLVVAIGVLMVLAALGLALQTIMLAYRRYQGIRVVRCPENRQLAAVEVDVLHAAATALLVRPELRLATCSSWPERRHCEQACLDQIESAPEESLVLRKLMRWYQGKSCALCGGRLDEIPALLGPDGTTFKWSEVPAEHLVELLSTHRPACWYCHVVETLHREHPELVVTSRQPSSYRH